MTSGAPCRQNGCRKKFFREDRAIYGEGFPVGERDFTGKGFSEGGFAQKVFSFPLGNAILRGRVFSLGNAISWESFSERIARFMGKGFPWGSRDCTGRVFRGKRRILPEGVPSRLSARGLTRPAPFAQRDHRRDTLRRMSGRAGGRGRPARQIRMACRFGCPAASR